MLEGRDDLKPTMAAEIDPFVEHVLCDSHDVLHSYSIVYLVGWSRQKLVLDFAVRRIFAELGIQHAGAKPFEPVEQGKAERCFRHPGDRQRGWLDDRGARQGDRNISEGIVWERGEVDLSLGA